MNEFHKQNNVVKTDSLECLEVWFLWFRLSTTEPCELAMYAASFAAIFSLQLPSVRAGTTPALRTA